MVFGPRVRIRWEYLPKLMETLALAFEAVAGVMLAAVSFGASAKSYAATLLTNLYRGATLNNRVLAFDAATPTQTPTNTPCADYNTDYSTGPRTGSVYPPQTINASGFITVYLSGLPAGAYNWRVQGPDEPNGGNIVPGFLANCGTASFAGAPQTNMDNNILKGGEAINGNILNFGSSDFNILKGNFGILGCPSTFTPEVSVGYAEALPGGNARKRKLSVVSKVK